MKPIIEHKKAELWLPPGGYVYIDDDFTDTVTRECIEGLAVAAEF